MVTVPCPHLLLLHPLVRLFLTSVCPYCPTSLNYLFFVQCPGCPTTTREICLVGMSSQWNSGLQHGLASLCHCGGRCGRCPLSALHGRRKDGLAATGGPTPGPRPPLRSHGRRTLQPHQGCSSHNHQPVPPTKPLLLTYTDNLLHSPV